MVAKPLKTRAKVEFGDFQTPPALALCVTQLLASRGVRPVSVLEPTCGRGAFLSAAVAAFPDAESFIGIDVNQQHLDDASADPSLADRRVQLSQGDFFRIEWLQIVTEAAGPWLIIGNPPWVTSSELGAIASANLPEKSNFQGRKGIDAITGKSNFDISEWMLLQYIEWLEGSAGTIAVLCKTAVARKVLLQAWTKTVPLGAAQIYRIDAQQHFGAAVEACLLILSIDQSGHSLRCEVFEGLDATRPSHALGFVDGHIVFDVEAFEQRRDLLGPEERYTWRSGVKHDCSGVMELTSTPEGYQNGSGERVAIEEQFLYPMLKSSDVGNARTQPRGVMLVTQQYVGEDTAFIKAAAPKTWDYLNSHAALLDKRGSKIYRNKPRFSVFGVGPYTFAPWKIAISGFYKKLKFVKVDPVNGRAVVFDDTVYFLGCSSEDEADFLLSLLESEPAQAFLASMIHWDEKRPITVDVLKRLSLRRLAQLSGLADQYVRFTADAQKAIPQRSSMQSTMPM